MLDFTSQKCLKQCILVATNITLRYQSALRASVGKQVKHEAEFELHQVKEQLRNAEDNIAYLSDRVITYRYRWLEEYYRAENLERHMPSGIYVPDLGQIPLGAPSPGFSTEFLAWDDIHICSKRRVIKDLTTRIPVQNENPLIFFAWISWAQILGGDMVMLKRGASIVRCTEYSNTVFSLPPMKPTPTFNTT
ncbi:hypothetical protein BD769DRAFT_1391651 [Suillus cothurnatus]|nr:hypothetical protein BD769DRAFT_1391651 [Suillus cothurnatus]